eukprot:gene1274-1687_t
MVRGRIPAPLHSQAKPLRPICKQIRHKAHARHTPVAHRASAAFLRCRVDSAGISAIFGQDLPGGQPPPFSRLH